MGDCPHWQPAIAMIIAMALQLLDLFTRLITSLTPLSVTRLMSYSPSDFMNVVVTF